LTANQTKDAQDAQNHFPWTSATADDQNRAPATLGQLKAVFSLRFEAYPPPTTGTPTEGDSDGDGYSDAWEMAHFGSLTHLNSAQDWAADPEQDGMSHATESVRGLDPAAKDNPKVQLQVTVE